MNEKIQTAVVDKLEVGKRNIIFRFIYLEYKVIDNGIIPEFILGDTLGYAFIPLNKLTDEQKKTLLDIKVLSRHQVEIVDNIEVNGAKLNLVKIHTNII